MYWRIETDKRRVIERIGLEKKIIIKNKILLSKMKSVSASKHNYYRTLNNSFSTPDKKINKVCV